jgi:hypothetical protein
MQAKERRVRGALCMLSVGLSCRVCQWSPSRGPPPPPRALPPTSGSSSRGAARPRARRVVGDQCVPRPAARLRLAAPTGRSLVAEHSRGATLVLTQQHPVHTASRTRGTSRARSPSSLRARAHRDPLARGPPERRKAPRTARPTRYDRAAARDGGRNDARRVAYRSIIV